MICPEAESHGVRNRQRRQKNEGKSFSKTDLRKVQGYQAVSYTHLDKIDKIKGMDITFTTTAKTDEEAQALLELLGMPFEK